MFLGQMSDMISGTWNFKSEAKVLRNRLKNGRHRQQLLVLSHLMQKAFLFASVTLMILHAARSVSCTGAVVSDLTKSKVV